MNILFFDTECNSLSTSDGFIMELAWAIYHQSGRLISSQSYLLDWNRGYTVDQGAFDATGLAREFCAEHGTAAMHVFEKFLIDAGHCGAICGHNILEFDIPMLDTNIKRAMFESPGLFLPRAIRIDTMHDIVYPSNMKSRSLEYLAMKHGLMMSGAHQALNDVIACAHVFFKYPVERTLAIAQSKFVNLHAYTDYHDQAGRDLMYNLKFRWDRDFKRWKKTAREYFVKEIADNMPDYCLFVDNQPYGQPVPVMNTMSEQLQLIATPEADERKAVIASQNEVQSKEPAGATSGGELASEAGRCGEQLPF